MLTQSMLTWLSNGLSQSGSSMSAAGLRKGRFASMLTQLGKMSFRKNETKEEDSRGGRRSSPSQDQQGCRHAAQMLQHIYLSIVGT